MQSYNIHRIIYIIQIYTINISLAFWFMYFVLYIITYAELLYFDMRWRRYSFRDIIVFSLDVILP